MPSDPRSPDQLPFDPLSARNLAVACALVGLGTILLSDRPTPGGVLLAWGGLAGWALLRLLGGRGAQPVRRKPRRRPIIEVVEVADWAPRRPPAPLALPKPIATAPPATNWSTAPHPAVLAGVRRRREEG
ncbi:hypothetical protein VQ02_15420 [Methylobacterium variabile]|jgi:hypothetical protein|uniref:Uncharacterized protein n=1 Tax=Methylobacterium variabile TaxID=298794 RepID=A0A0J6SRU4_9HYPH|nr:hypothetical protein [Methylobacterium variabile]KMO36419.1 hypothetical protein VQ02_15420 [Methylobacterium variabile]